MVRKQSKKRNFTIMGFNALFNAFYSGDSSDFTYKKHVSIHSERRVDYKYGRLLRH